MTDTDESPRHQALLGQAVELARGCDSREQQPGGAVLARVTDIVASGVSRRVATGDPIRYAVMDCISNAGRRTDQARLTLYISGALTWLDTGTIVQFGIGAVVTDAATARDADEQLEFLRNDGVSVTVVQTGPATSA